MKITTGHAVSLVLNGLLIMLVVVQWRPRKLDDAAPPESTFARHHPPASGGANSKSAATESSPIQIGAGLQQWIGPLRGAGVPADVLATLVQTDFDRRWQHRAAELQQKYLQGQVDADALAALALDHDTQLDTELRTALGAEAFRRWDMAQVMQSLNASQVRLSDSERDTVYELERGLRADLRNAQADKLRGTIDQATLNAREQGEQEAAAQKLRALLGEQRAAQLQGVDDTLGNLKRGLSAVPLSDGQLAALADTQRNWDQSRSQLVALQNNTGDPAYAGAVGEAEAKWRDDFQRIAGPVAWEQFQKSQDNRYADLQRFAAAWRISPVEIENIFNTIGSYDETVRAYGLDAQVRAADPGAAQAALQQFEQQTESSLQLRLGASRYAELQQNGIVP